MQPQPSQPSAVNALAMPLLEVVGDRGERAFFKNYIFIIPTIFVLRIGFEYFLLGKSPDVLFDQIKMLVEGSILIFIALFNHACKAVPHYLMQIFSDSECISQRSDGVSKAEFLKHFNTRLNSDLRRSLAVLTAFCTLNYYIVRIGGLGRLFQANTPSFYYYFLAYMIPAVIYAYFIGIALWKIIVIVYRIQSIPDLFLVMVDFKHPDRANGLLPVGQTAVQLIYIFVAPTIISAFIVIGPFIRSVTGADVPLANQGAVFGFSVFILFFAIVGSLALIQLIFKYHNVILAQTGMVFRNLNAIATEISRLRSTSESLVGSPKQAELKNYLEQIEVLERLYQSTATINSWPLNRQYLLKIWTTQTFLVGQGIALWNLLSGL